MKRQVIIRYTLEKEDTRRIKAYMKRHKISIRFLAKCLGYSPTFVCDMLNGKAYLSDKFHVWININVPNKIIELLDLERRKC